MSDDMKIVEGLLTDEGLNHSSYMRGLGLDDKDAKNREKTKKDYEDVLQCFEGVIVKQGHDFFFTEEEKEKRGIVSNDNMTEEDIPPSLLQKIKAKILGEAKETIKAEIEEERVSGDPSRKAWRYHPKHAPQGRLFEGAELDKKEEEGWDDHPAPVKKK